MVKGAWYREQTWLTNFDKEKYKRVLVKCVQCGENARDYYKGVPLCERCIGDAKVR